MRYNTVTKKKKHYIPRIKTLLREIFSPQYFVSPLTSTLDLRTRFYARCMLMPSANDVIIIVKGLVPILFNMNNRSPVFCHREEKLNFENFLGSTTRKDYHLTEDGKIFTTTEFLYMHRVL